MSVPDEVVVLVGDFMAECRTLVSGTPGYPFEIEHRVSIRIDRVDGVRSRSERCTAGWFPTPEVALRRTLVFLAETVEPKVLVGALGKRVMELGALSGQATYLDRLDP